jgi:hypothetical protein
MAPEKFGAFFVKKREKTKSCGWSFIFQNLSNVPPFISFETGRLSG